MKAAQSDVAFAAFAGAVDQFLCQARDLLLGPTRVLGDRRAAQLVHVRANEVENKFRVMCAHAWLGNDGSLLFKFPIGVDDSGEKLKWSDSFEDKYLPGDAKDSHRKQALRVWADELNMWVNRLTSCAIAGRAPLSNQMQVAGRCDAGEHYEPSRCALIVALLGGPDNGTPASCQGGHDGLKPLPLATQALADLSTYLALGHIPAPIGRLRCESDEKMASFVGRSDTQYFRPSVAAQYVVKRPDGEEDARGIRNKLLSIAGGWREAHQDGVFSPQMFSGSCDKAGQELMKSFKGAKLYTGPEMGGCRLVYALVGQAWHIVVCKTTRGDDAGKQPCHAKESCAFRPFTFGVLKLWEETKYQKDDGMKIYSPIPTDTDAAPVTIPYVVDGLEDAERDYEQVSLRV